MYRFFLAGIIFLFGFYACNLFDGSKSDPRLARVNNEYLYASDLEGIIKPGTSPSDSALIAERHIDNWVRQQVFLQEAKASLSDEQMDFQRKIKDYKNSLIIFTHESQLIKQQLDTVISDDLLLDYYEKHKEEFTLRDNIVKVNFMKLPLDAPEMGLVRRLIRSDDPEDIERLEEHAVNHAASYFLDQDAWFIFTDILRDIPINPSNHEAYLRNNTFVERNDQYYRYFMYIHDYRLEGSTSPLAFQADNIESILLNQRKQELINQFRKDFFRKADERGAIEVY